MDQADLDFLATNVGALSGWSDERTAMMASLKVWTRSDMTATTHIWLDNLRVYRSAYELDMGLAKTKYSVHTDGAPYQPPTLIAVGATGNMDGTFESYAGNLGAIGFTKENGSGDPGAYRKAPYGTLAAGATYADAAAAAVSVNTSVDHTKSAGSSKCLQIAMAGTDGTNLAVRAWVDSTLVAVPGSGIYCAEAFVSKQRATNSLSTDRTPTYTVGLLQMAPNAFVGYGAYLKFGGIPISVGEETNNWMRVVGTGYINDAELLLAFVQMEEAFDATVSSFSVPSYFDDIAIYRVDDPAKFFDADLFDSI
jgi:hypothetical protein